MPSQTCNGEATGIPGNRARALNKIQPGECREVEEFRGATDEKTIYAGIYNKSHAVGAKQ